MSTAFHSTHSGQIPQNVGIRTIGLMNTVPGLPHIGRWMHAASCLLVARWRSPLPPMTPTSNHHVGRRFFSIIIFPRSG